MSDVTVLNFIAYLDPGTGSLLIQLLLGAIVGSGVWFRKYVIATVARLFRFGRESPEETPEEAAPGASPEAPAGPEVEVSGEAEEAREEVTEATH